MKTWHVVWPGVPQVAGPFTDLFAAMTYAQFAYDRDVHEPEDDPDYVRPDYRWSIGTGDNRADLYEDGRPTPVHIALEVPQPIDCTSAKVIIDHGRKANYMIGREP